MTHRTPPKRRGTAASRKAAEAANPATTGAAGASNPQRRNEPATNSHETEKQTNSTEPKLTSKGLGARPKVRKSQSQSESVSNQTQAHAILVNNPAHAPLTTQPQQDNVTEMQQSTVSEAEVLPQPPCSQPTGAASQDAVSQLEGMPSSTPATSPAFTGRRSPPFLDISDEMWNTTPFQQSSGIGLIAAPSPIYSLPKKPSVAQLENSLEKLADHIEHYGARFRETERWRDHFQETSGRYSKELDVIQARSVEVHAMPVMARCFALKSLLGKYTEELKADAEALVSNPTTSHVEIRHSLLSQPLTTSTTDATGTHSQQLHDCSVVPSDSPPVQNREVQEPPVPVTLPFSFGELCNKVSALESFTPTVLSIPDLDKRLTLVEKYRARASAVDDLATKVNLLEEVMKAQDSELASGIQQIKTLEERLTGNTLACRQYEQIASGVVLENIQLKKQFQTLLSRMENLQDQVDGVNSRTVIPMEQNMIADINPLSAICSRTPTVPITRYVTAVSGIHQLSNVSSSPPVTTNTRLISNHCIMSTGHNVDVPTCNQNTSHPPIMPGLGCFLPAGNLSFPQDGHPPSHPSQAVNEDGPTPPNGSPESSPSSSLTGLENLSREGRRLKKMAMNLRKMLHPNVSTDIPKSTLQDIYKSTVNTVDSERKDLSKALDRYEKSRDPDFSLCDEVEDTIEDATKWTAGMREMHRQLGYHKQSLNKKLYENLQKFSIHSEINIFEFLRRFELYTEEQGSPTERAELLYNSYWTAR